jgi:hypothetical protein
VQVETAVESPELQKLGLRLELDKATGKMQVVKTETGQQMAADSPQMPLP